MLELQIVLVVSWHPMKMPGSLLPSFVGLLGLAAPLGCVVDPGQADTEGSSEGGSSTTTVTDDDSGFVTSIEPPPPDTTDDTSTEGSTGEPPPACRPEPDTAECGLMSQLCPEGQHCVPWFEEGVGFDSYACRPVVDDPVPRLGECTPDHESCNDDCDEGYFCFPQTSDGQGVCVQGWCSPVGSIDQTCARDEACTFCEDCQVNLCMPMCDPLDPQCSAGVPACLPVEDDRFACLPESHGELGLGEPCTELAACEAGLVCMEEAALGPDCAGGSCCTELCDLVDGEPGCSNPAHECLPYLVPGDVAETLAHVGFCGLPSAHPCLTVPGACPPDGIDDAYPWCSPINFTACADGDWRLRYIDCTDPEPSGCMCLLPCTIDADCPVPTTGNAVPVCEDAEACSLSCAGGETCPDGMTCSDVVFGECIWVSPLAPEDCR
jgi:hypothetical protein